MMMCEWGHDIVLLVPMPAELSYTGKFRWDYKGIDSCIAPIVQALNDAGIYTANSCCGHGKGNGIISLHDGRNIFIQNPLSNNEGMKLSEPEKIICTCGHALEVHNQFNCIFAFEKENECHCPLGKETIIARHWAIREHKRADKAEQERDEARRNLNIFLGWRNANDPYA